MNVNVTTVLKDFEGNALKDGEREITLRHVLLQVLGATFPPDVDRADGAEKAKRWALAVKIVNDDEVLVTAEDAAMLKKLVGIGYGPYVVGPVYDLLDGKPTLKLV